MLKVRNHLTTASSQPRLRLFPVTVFFNRQWWWSTLLVLVAILVMMRLGFWQLGRLEQRRARNAEITHQLALPPLFLTGNEPLPADLASLKIRRGTARGEFDFSRQVALKHQNWMGSPGVHLITPLIIEGGSRAVLVDRGWIPQAEALPERWSQFDEPGPVTMLGFIQLSQSLPQSRIGADQAGERVDNSGRIAQTKWYRVDIAAIQDQLPYELLPVYIQQSPPAGSNGSLPYRSEPEFDLSDGPHMGYAIQWYIFALILGIGYARYVIKRVTKVTEESA